MNDGRPEVKEVIGAWEEARSTERAQVEEGSRQRAENTRRAYWTGQDASGKKLDDVLKEDGPAFPWDGASDTRVRMADGLCNWISGMLRVALKRAALTVEGVEAADAAVAGRAAKRLAWARGSGIERLYEEAELAAQYMTTYGWAVVQVVWARVLQRVRRRVTMEDIQRLGEGAAPGSVAWLLPGLIADPEREQEAAAALRGFYPLYAKAMETRLLPEELPELGMGRARALVRELRTERETMAPVVKVAANRPAVVALQPYEDFFVSKDCTELQRARHVFRVDWLSVEEMRAGVLENGWDEEWVEAVVRQKGAESAAQDATGGPQRIAVDRSELCKLVWVYTRAVDEDGVRTVWLTVISPALGEKQAAPQEELGYEHGEYPFVELARERIGRAFMESRGVPEIVATWQEEAKVQRDAAVDRTSIEIVPPLKVPTRDLGKQIRLRPAGQIGQDHAGTVEWMQPPAGNLQASAMVLQEVNREVAEYFGKPAELVAPALAQIAQQLAVDRWLESWKAVFRQVDALMRQFLSDEEWERISGESAAERALAESAAEYDWSMDFDVTRLDAETLTARLKAFMDFALAADAAGVIDRAKFTALVATAIDPSIASAVLQDAGQASQQLFRQVREQLGMMALGNPPELTPDADPAAAAKLRFTEDVMNQNPKYQAALKQDPVFQEQFGKWMKSLQFNVAQASNRMVGRFGA